MNKADILAEAKKRFKQCQTWESSARNNFRSDMKFGYGDSVNLFQWQTESVDARTASGKPCFTVNRVKPYCQQIINDAKQNKAQIEVRAVGGGASFKAAEIIEGVVRHIEYISNAEAAYEHATHDMVFGGIGYWRIVTDYAHDDSFDQECFIRPVKDTLSVYLDPHMQQRDGSDASFGFIFTDMDRDEFKRSYPKYKDAIADLPFSMETHDDLWLREDRVRIAEYYRKTIKADKLHHLDDGQTMRESEIADEDMDMVMARSVRARDISVPTVEWYMIVGDRIVEQTTFPSQYIPIVRAVAQEVVLEGVMDRISHVRAHIDSQRAYNWNTSAGIEFVAGQTKSPWLADTRSIEGLESYYRDANVKNYAVLPYKGVDESGQPIEPPKRADPPVYAAAFLDGMKVAASEMEMTSGQPAAVMGDTSNERSGKAVLERQRAAANVTYHFVNGLSEAIRFSGKIIIDLITNGKVYDTRRILKVLAQDGEMQTVMIDPQGQQAHMPVQGLDRESFSAQQVAAVINPQVGQYDVVAEIGPQFTTRRQEFVSSLMDILSQNESLAPVVGDLLFRNMDFPGADEIAERLRNMVPPQALGTVNPEVQHMQQQLQVMQGALHQMAQELRDAKMKGDSIAMQKDIDYYKAETERLAAIGKIDAAALKPIVRDMVSELIGIPVNQAIAMHMAEDAAMMRAMGPQGPQGAPQQQSQPQLPPPTSMGPA